MVAFSIRIVKVLLNNVDVNYVFRKYCAMSIKRVFKLDGQKDGEKQQLNLKLYSSILYSENKAFVSDNLIQCTN